jgi:hypothetical protein
LRTTDPDDDEAGLPGFYMAVWHGIWLPSGAPRPVSGTRLDENRIQPRARRAFPRKTLHASAAVQIAGLLRRALIEIDAVAFIPD